MRVLVGTWGEGVGLGGCGYEECGLGEGGEVCGGQRRVGYVALGSEGGRSLDC